MVTMTDSWKLTLVRVAGVFSLFFIAPNFIGPFQAAFMAFSLFLIVWPSFARRGLRKRGLNPKAPAASEPNVYEGARYEPYRPVGRSSADYYGE